MPKWGLFMLLSLLPAVAGFAWAAERNADPQETFSYRTPQGIVLEVTSDGLSSITTMATLDRLSRCSSRKVGLASAAMRAASAAARGSAPRERRYKR